MKIMGKRSRAPISLWEKPIFRMVAHRTTFWQPVSIATVLRSLRTGWTDLLISYGYMKDSWWRFVPWHDSFLSKCPSELAAWLTFGWVWRARRWCIQRCSLWRARDHRLRGGEQRTLTWWSLWLDSWCRWQISHRQQALKQCLPVNSRRTDEMESTKGVLGLGLIVPKIAAVFKGRH